METSVNAAKQALEDSLEHETQTRAAADGALKDAEAALRADTDSAHRELRRSISELDERTAGALAKLKSEAEEAVVDGFKGRDLPTILARVRRAIFAAIRFFAHSSRFRHSAFLNPSSSSAPHSDDAA